MLAQRSPSPRLALAYYHSLSPVLRTSRSLRLLFAALTSTSVAEAFWFSREFADDGGANATQRALFESLLEGVLGGSGAEDEYVRHPPPPAPQKEQPESTHAQQHHKKRGKSAVEDADDPERHARRAAQLVGLPFTPEEEGWYEDYLLRGHGRRLHRARDAVLARRAVTRRLVPAAGGDRLPGALQGRWGALVEGLRAAGAGASGAS